jgi:hypothetical protein
VDELGNATEPCCQVELAVLLPMSGPGAGPPVGAPRLCFEPDHDGGAAAALALDVLVYSACAGTGWAAELQARRPRHGPRI